jgi:GDP-L-fucose synthase
MKFVELLVGTDPGATATGFQGEIAWDDSKPDGTPKKQLDVSRLQR